MPRLGPVRRLLIANRGEIAVRIARACRGLEIVPVAIASQADRAALHARVADETVVIGPATAPESYLHIGRILAAARERRCDAVHPGYGFLSQNPRFAEEVTAAGLVFVGPPARAMRMMGDKIASRRAMQTAGVPVIPGYEGTGDEDLATLAPRAEAIGYPVLVKAAGGGGGRGMRVVRRPEDLPAALEGARGESLRAFGDGRLFLEKCIEEARHVEIQVLADGDGSCVHLFERECSVQRRFQKVVEESPSTLLDEGLRRAMGAAAVAAARACGYVGAGTVEFLVGPDRSFHFLEMNTRIQVEHPVTEMVTGVDLVEAQIRIASGERLPWRQEDLRRRGHAIECRLNAEDPAEGFLPSSGTIRLAEFPGGPGVRVDAGVETGDEVTPFYDSLLAKIVVHADDRASALARMDEALGRTVVIGVRTNLSFLRAIIGHPVFREGRATTGFLENDLGGWRPDAGPDPDDLLLAAAVTEMIRSETGPAVPAGAGMPEGADRFSPWDRADGYLPGRG